MHKIFYTSYIRLFSVCMHFITNFFKIQLNKQHFAINTVDKQYGYPQHRIIKAVSINMLFERNQQHSLLVISEGNTRSHLTQH